MHLRHHQSIKIGILRYIYVHLHTTYVHRAFTNSLAVKTYLYRLLSAPPEAPYNIWTMEPVLQVERYFCLNKKQCHYNSDTTEIAKSIANRTHIPR